MQFARCYEKNTREMTANSLHHGGKENTIFYSKFNVLEFLDIDNLHKKFESYILKIIDF